MFFSQKKFELRAEELEKRRWVDMTSLEWFDSAEGALSSGQVYHGCMDVPAGNKVMVGDEFNGRDRYLWLQKQVTLPEKKDGCDVMGFFDFGKTGIGNNSGFEAMLYVDGHPFQGVDSNHREVIFNDYAGKNVRLTFLLWSGLEGGGPVTTQYHRISRASIGWRDKKLHELYYMTRNISETIDCLDGESPDKLKLTEIMDRTLAVIDWDEDRIRETGAEALLCLNRELEACPDNSPVTVYAVGHTHIDVSWLWRLKHTREKAQRSFSTVLRLMEEDEGYKFLQSQPQLYRFIKKDCPELYEGIKKRAAEGRWEADGGMWLEADCNVISGESLVRQFLYGTRFLKEEFGKECHFLWLPDVFGYSWALPQIMKLCNLDTFATTKISWNQYNSMPNDLFRWRGIDGTEILTYFIDVPDSGQPETSHGSTYNGKIMPETIRGTWKKFKNKELSREVLISYGFGDGGGGPTRDMLESIRAINRLPGMPKVEMKTAGEFFHKIHENVEQTDRHVPVWDGELYLEYHRGTYTSQADNKKHNRKLEYALGELEWLSLLAGLAGGATDEKAIHECWETVLRNQFHDIIPGSSIHEVYEDTDKEYEEVWELADNVKNQAAQVLCKPQENTWTAFRFADVSGGELLFLPGEEDGRFFSDDGTGLDAQKVPGGWLVETEVKPVSSAGIHFKAEERAEKESPFKLNMPDRTLETPFYEIKWDECGAITSLYDKEHDRQILRGRGNVLRVYEDKPMQYDAWDIDIYYTQKYEDIPAEMVSCTEDGGLRMKLKFCYTYRASAIEQEMVLYRNSRRIDFATQVDWHEDHRLLKTLFEVDVRATKASYDIQFGHVERPTHWNTSWDWARFEVCGHKWADLSEADYGVSLLNDCKYGYGIHDNVMGLSLLKSAKHPDTEADMGRHEFTYSLLPHSGSLGSETISEGIRLNQPSFVLEGAAAGNGKQLIRTGCDSVKIDAVKAAEDGDGFVVHLHECRGGREKVLISSDYQIKAYAECNLLEDYEERVESDTIACGFGPFQIRSFRVWF